MIKKSTPLSMSEATKYLEKDKEDIKSFIKKFTKIKSKDAEEFRKKLQELDIIKMNDNQISKVIDFLPTTAEELSKIFTDVGLNEDETKKIVDVVVQFK